LPDACSGYASPRRSAGSTGVSAVTYSAFAEPLGDGQSLGRRFRYAGGWGYQADLLVLEGAPGTGPITLIHVGHRWYQPDIGRFIQRDPLGIFGGLNTYAYADANPLNRVDPFGLYSMADPEFKFREWLKWIVSGGSGGAAAGAKTRTLKGVLIGAGLGAVGGAVGYPVWVTGETVCVRVADTGEALGQLEDQNRKNRRQREDNPDVCPPWEPPDIDAGPECPP
jgi:RHS repeat-associated protein